MALTVLSPQRRQWQPTPVFLPGESQGQRSLLGCRLWGRTESDTTDATQQQQQQQQQQQSSVALFTKVGRGVYVCFVTMFKKKKKGSFSLHNHMALFAHMETLLQTITGIWNQLSSIHYPTIALQQIPYLYFKVCYVVLLVPFRLYCW